ncbi:MAG: enoyl-CoA hydratase/isomerase family protein [Flavobacteriaceae bacterium]
MSSQTLDVTLEGGIARITFGHTSSNAMTVALLEAVAKAIDGLKNEGVSVVILQSEGDRVFCAGANFDELLALKTSEEATRFFNGFANVILAIRRCSAIVLGRIQAKAVGGGVGLIAACDYAMATEDASIKLSEIGIGIAPLVIEPAVSRKIGVGAMAEFAIHPKDWKTAKWAHENKLYQSVYESISHLDQAVDALARELSNCNPEALAALKISLWEGTEHWEALLGKRAEASGKLALSDRAQQIISDFKNRS